MYTAYSQTGAPKELEESAVSSTTASIQWNLPFTRNQNTSINHYKITVYTRESDTTNVYLTNQSFFNLTSLHPNYHYSIKVVAVTNVTGPNATIDIQTAEDSE